MIQQTPSAVRSVLACLCACSTMYAQTPPAPNPNPLAPQYKAGDVLRYEMKGDNEGWQYTIQATDTVKQDASGMLYEEIGWSGLQSNAPMVLSPASLAFRQTVSRDLTGKYLTAPDLSKVQPLLIGPITDTLTIYSDLLLARTRKLGPEHPHAIFEHPSPNSWADGQHFVVAQDAVDFDLTFIGMDAAQGTETVLVRHVPPLHPGIQLAAAWMREPVANAPNNWVQVSHDGAGYLAEVGMETFDVRLVLDTQTGELLSAHISNPTTAIRRHCDDVELERCAPPTPETIKRVVDLHLVPAASTQAD